MLETNNQLPLVTNEGELELTTTEMIDQRINYVHENPVRTGLVAKAEDYLYSSARNYAGLSSIIEIDLI